VGEVGYTPREVPGPPRLPSGVFTGISIVLHGLGFVAVATLAPDGRALLRQERILAEFELVEEPAALMPEAVRRRAPETATRPPPAPPDPDEAPVDPEAPRPVNALPGAAAAGAVAVDPGAAVDPFAVGSAAGVVPPEQAGMEVLRARPGSQGAPDMGTILDPRAVARGSIAMPDGPSQRGPAATAERRVIPGGSEAEVEARLAGGLREEAMARPHTRRRPPIRPRRQTDGRYVYSGPVFTATISADGRDVEFADQAGASYDLSSGSGSLDIGQLAMQAAGQDPYAYERERFYRETRELRARLEAEAREREMTGSLRTLRGRLRRLWDNETRPARVRRRRIFQEFDELDPGPMGNRARRAILAFVRENMPAGSDDAYPAEELRSLNAGREGEHAFEPY
jgi:hypothetical protein